LFETIKTSKKTEKEKTEKLAEKMLDIAVFSLANV